MKKIGRIGYMSIGVIFTLIVSFTVLSFADQTSNQTSGSTTEMDGKLTVVDKTNDKITFFDGKQKQDFTLDHDTVIYRNGQKSSLDQIQFTDDVKLTLNSQHLVRYVVATSTKQPEQLQVQAQANNSTKSVSPKQSDNNGGNNVQTQYSTSEIRELQLHIDYGHGTNYEIHYNIDPHGKMDSHIHKKTENEDVDLKDGEATAYIQSLLQQLKITGNMSETDVINQLESILKINASSFSKLDFKLRFSDNNEINVHYDSKQPKGEKKQENPKDHKK